MATRMYIDRNGYTPTPSFTPIVRNTAWNSDSSLTYTLAPAGHASLTVASSLIRTVATTASAATIVHALCYSPPMQGSYSFNAATTYTLVHRILEATLTMDVFAQFVVGCVNNAGVAQVWTGLIKDGTEASTTSTSRTNTSTGSMIYTSSPGDRIFIEMGWDKDAAISGNVSIPYMYSTTAGDLDNTDADTGVQNLWFETSMNITFDAEGTTYGGNKNLMMMGCGS